MESFNFKITISPDVISQEVQLGETLLMDVKTLAYFGLNALGSTLWAAMQTSADADEVFARFVDSSDVAEEQLAVTFRSILDGLEKSRLVTIERA